ncbi:hypothetical protein [Paraburkholderia sp. LEh10]|uniref:hypothetical protein n=1 Tax=Paraburkholderia sp. LEh10 TaxID=2821353 RepID=UPI002476904E|nr:hypothetical protein [Paraburkholderia sp. LEh10]
MLLLVAHGPRILLEELDGEQLMRVRPERHHPLSAATDTTRRSSRKTTVICRTCRWRISVALDSSLFLRVRRSHIVSLPHALALLKADQSMNLVMGDAQRSVVPVSRTRPRY